jgi:hypothetical protein
MLRARAADSWGTTKMPDYRAYILGGEDHQRDERLAVRKRDRALEFAGPAFHLADHQ